MNDASIAIIGSCVCDVVVELPHLPTSSEDVNIINQSMTLGGCAYNVANILQCLQVPFTLFSPIATGVYADFVRTRLHQKGITSLLDPVEGENGCCYCLVEQHGERSFLSYHGSEYLFQPDWFSKLPSTIDTAYVCGLELEESTGIHILTYLQKHPDILVYFAPGPRILEIDTNLMEAMFQRSCILHINEDEALRYTKCLSIKDALHYLYHKTNAPVIITLGENGSCCFDGEHVYEAPSFPTIVVDTIGAGDAHIGAIIALRHLQVPWFQSLLIANKIASIVVSKKGSGLDADDLNEIEIPQFIK